MDVTEWLRSLGLEQYASAFLDNRVDAEILAKLTGDDLKEIGVAMVGDRRRLLEAIAVLRERAAPAATGGSAPDPAAGPAAERRQLTVMFRDLVGSTALSARLDPEELREVIGAYHRCVAVSVRRFDGFVAKYMGDGVLVYFGYPRAHEDDAERAVRAGLAVVEAVRAIGAAYPLEVRIGIATGSSWSAISSARARRRSRRWSARRRTSPPARRSVADGGDQRAVPQGCREPGRGIAAAG
jgi:class 3 adenylate cyclase